MSRLALALAAVCLLSACEEMENGITGPCGFGQPCFVDPIASISLTLPAAPMVPGDTATVSVTVLDTSGAPIAADVAFESSDSAVATVTAEGVVVALAAGSAILTARAGDREASASLQVAALVANGVSAGKDASCVTTNLPERSQCWGLGDAGQLGYVPDTACFADDTINEAPLGCAIAPRVLRRDLSLTSISVGDSLACGIGSDGAAWCWGANAFGQLGTGGLSTGTGPQRVLAPNGIFTAVSAGGRHACGISAATTYCWGEDSLGQLGDARTINSTTPIPVITSQIFTAISAGLRHTCAVAGEGSAFCWGNNESGQLGIGTATGFRDTPVAVGGGHAFTAVSAGDSASCGVLTDGAVLCWGANTHGQLGRGSSGVAIATPAPVAIGGPFIAVSVGAGFACALEASGQAMCWGQNTYGQLGSAGGSSSTPRAVDGGIAFTSISAGARHACATTAAGTVHCWGSNVFGALGNRLQAAVRGTPVLVTLGR